MSNDALNDSYSAKCNADSTRHAHIGMQKAKQDLHNDTDTICMSARQSMVQGCPSFCLDAIFPSLSLLLFTVDL
jgi:hypothetical protein